MALAPGARLGPYEVVAPLGAGGMGEVYRARDPRLDREVAVKILATGETPNADRLRRFEDEARAAGALNHPNVLTVFDVGSEAGSPYVVFELLDGETLGERLQRGPLPPRTAVVYAVQACHGLAAAHDRGIVHRDLKPGNLFVNADGHLKVLDFGLAKLTQGPHPIPDTEGPPDRTATDPGLLMGTLAYMSPEQARGQAADPRSDIFALGATLYEMLSGRPPFLRPSPAETVSAILSQDPQPLDTSAEGPLAAALEPILRRCLEKNPDERFQSARDLGFALGALAESPLATVSARPKGAHIPASPYPGLSPFVETDAERFFGREEEVVRLWEAIAGHALLAVIGPSGAGKTSVLRAGVIPRRPAGWRVAYATPGANPPLALARALVPALAGDAEGVEGLLQAVSDFSPDGSAAHLAAAVTRWKGLGDGLLVLDQFEELFTLSSPEAQARFAELLARLAEQAGVHVLLCLRDDFLFRCHALPALAPVFRDLTPVGPPSAAAMRRALVEPALRMGVRFEVDTLADAMVSSVAEERGALPLLAFAAARLWEERDRQRKLLTREAYERIGGVAGALAEHAEATMQRIGPSGEGVVREIFRNLVTPEGTRATRGRAELLSVFRPGGRSEAEAVLDALTSARLLTEYSLDGDPPRLEVVHESLLTHWPRLERWLVQDAEQALLRDQLGRAARLWHERGRPGELLWEGRAYQEFRMWRARYPGGLTEVETDFARAMDVQVTRRTRQRRAAVVITIAALTIALAIIGGLWTRAERERAAAQAEARHREADQLVALGRLRLAESPSEALAYALASLERADNEPARRFAVAALWQGPTPSVFAIGDVSGLWDVSADGRFAVMGTASGVKLWSREGGDARRLPFASLTNPVPWAGFSADSRRVVVTHPAERVARVFSVEDAQEVQAIEIGDERSPHGILRGDRVFDIARPGTADRMPAGFVWIRAWSLFGERPRRLGRWLGARAALTMDGAGSRLVELRDGVVGVRRVDALETAPRTLGSHAGAFDVGLHPSGNMVYTDSQDELRVWALDRQSPSPVRTIRAPQGTLFCNEWGAHPRFDPTGRVLAVWLRAGSDASSCSLAIIDLEGPPAAESVALTKGLTMGFRFDATGRWLLSAHGARSYVWPISDRRPRVLRVPALQEGPAFTPDGRFLAAGSATEMRLWPLTATGSPSASERTFQAGSKRSFEFAQIAVDPRGRFLVVAGDQQDEVALLPIVGDGSRRFRVPGAWVGASAVSPDGRSVAASIILPRQVGSARIHVWDAATGAERVYDPRATGEDCASNTAWEGAVFSLTFLSDGKLLSVGNSGLRVWDLATGRSERILECDAAAAAPTAYWNNVAVSPAAGLVARLVGQKLTVFDLERRVSREITTHGLEVETVALDAAGRTLVTGDRAGVIRSGPVTGEEPHLFFGHTGGVSSISLSPDGRWIASASWARVSNDERLGDQTIRLWPMPQGPPLHTLPHGELMGRLRSLTNLRVLPDPAAPNAYRVVPGPFRGWRSAPGW
jgi:WD40 repeat protein